MTIELKPCPFCGRKPIVMECTRTSEGEETTTIGCMCGARLVATKRYLITESVDEHGRRIRMNTGIKISEGAEERWNRRNV